MSINTIRFCCLASLAFAVGRGADAQVMPLSGVDLAPHRAVYDLSLSGSGSGSNVTDIRGQLVYDFTGSACDGYTLNTRLVTQIFDREGKPSVTDVRSQSFEQGDAARYRFDTSQYQDSKLRDSTRGTATRRSVKTGVYVELQKPRRDGLLLSGTVYFPTQHSVEILKAAMQGQTRLQANIYDGSEKGDKVYETTTVIGAAIPPSADGGLPAVKNAEALGTLQAWPVLVSYYDQGQGGDGLPAYEVSFRMYSNGVSRKLKLDYGSFSLSGELSSIEFLKAKACSRSRGANSGLGQGG